MIRIFVLVNPHLNISLSQKLTLVYIENGKFVFDGDVRFLFSYLLKQELSDFFFFLSPEIKVE